MGDAGTPGHEGRTRLIIVEDQELLLDALAHSPSLEQDFRVISRLRSAADADAEVSRLHPDLVLMTAMPDITFLEGAKTAGATAFVYKDMPADELVTVLCQARRRPGRIGG